MAVGTLDFLTPEVKARLMCCRRAGGGGPVNPFGDDGQPADPFAAVPAASPFGDHVKRPVGADQPPTDPFASPGRPAEPTAANPFDEPPADPFAGVAADPFAGAADTHNPFG